MSLTLPSPHGVLANVRIMRPEHIRQWVAILEIEAHNRRADPRRQADPLAKIEAIRDAIGDVWDEGALPVTDINVRGVDGDLWRRLRAAAVVRQVPLGKLLNDIIREWLEHHP